jgi:hypothetical protein
MERLPSLDEDRLPSGIVNLQSDGSEEDKRTL